MYRIDFVQQNFWWCSRHHHAEWFHFISIHYYLLILPADYSSSDQYYYILFLAFLLACIRVVDTLHWKYSLRSVLLCLPSFNSVVCVMLGLNIVSFSVDSDPLRFNRHQLLEAFSSHCRLVGSGLLFFFFFFFVCSCSTKRPSQELFLFAELPATRNAATSGAGCRLQTSGTSQQVLFKNISISQHADSCSPVLLVW